MSDDLNFRKIFAPTGELRAVINLGNAVLAKAGAKNKGPTGVTVDLAKKFALQLDVPLKLISVQKAADAVNAVATAKADIGFFAVDPERAALISFTQPHDNSAIQTIADVDKEDNRIVVGHGSAYDLHLSRVIKHAEIIRAPSSQDVVNHFLAHRFEVAAGVRQQLEMDAALVSSVHLLPGHFMEIQQAMGVSKERGKLAGEYLNQFVRLIKESGEVHQILDDNQVKGAAVAD